MPRDPHRDQQPHDEPLTARYATERRRQLWALWLIAVLVLIASVWRAGLHNVFLPGWWRIDHP